MTVNELYSRFSERIPEQLSEEWDNDGLMCSADGKAEVTRALLTLDVTEEIVDYAIESGFDLIVSHHPLIFRPLTALNEDNHVARKLIKLIENGISVFSFHTRADKVGGGVNDRLCDLLGMYDTSPFGEDMVGRVGELDEEMSLEDFAYKVKDLTASDAVKYADGYNPVRRVAVVGGDGKDYVGAAVFAGADTYLSGRISYNLMEEAAELGINLIEAGHYYTEMPVLSFFSELVGSADISLTVDLADSNMIELV